MISYELSYEGVRMHLVPWIISGVMIITLVYVIWLYRKKSTPETIKQNQNNKSIDIGSVNNIVRLAFSQFGFENQNQVTDVMSLEAFLFDGIMGIKEKSEDAKYVETLIRLEPILHDLESLANAKWASKEVSDFITNTIQLLEHTLGIVRITEYSSGQLENSKYWVNYEPSEAGKVEKRYSPWVYRDQVVIQGVLQRRQDAN
jgi:hypothetical protein